MDKEIIQIQLAWFFSADYVGSFEKVSSMLKEKFGESKITQYLPVPSAAPSEIPRLILGYEQFNINISKNRLDLFFKDFSTVRSVVSDIDNILLDNLSLSIGRIGFVKTLFINNDIESLKKLLPKEKMGALDLKEIAVRVNEKKTIEGYECNSIESLSSGFVVGRKVDGSEVKKEGIIMTRDINTLAEALNENKFTKEIMDKLIGAFDEESNKLIIYCEE